MIHSPKHIGGRERNKCKRKISRCFNSHTTNTKQRILITKSSTNRIANTHCTSMRFDRNGFFKALSTWLCTTSLQVLKEIQMLHQLQIFSRRAIFLHIGLFYYDPKSNPPPCPLLTSFYVFQM